VLQSIKHAYTEATIITSRAVLCDNPGSGCDRGSDGISVALSKDHRYGQLTE
jgi:hypothetical protein